MPKLSADTLKVRIATLQKQLAEAEKHRGPAIRTVRALMKKLGVTLVDLSGAAGTPASRRGKKPSDGVKPAARSGKKSALPVPVKYRDEAGNTWTGRGKTPRWLVEAEKSGQARESFKL
jgi:DNA-binding protein H-NS